MFAPLFLAVAAGSFGFTWAFTVRESAVVFAAAMAVIGWTVMALTPELTVATGGTTTTVAVGPIQYAFAVLAMLSMVALIGAIFGIYPESETPEVTPT